MIPKILVIPDAHVVPEVDNYRFSILGQFIVDEQPDYVICLGDFADLASLSRWDKGKQKGEGKYFEDDMNAVIDANEKLWAPLKDYNRRFFRKNNKVKYDPVKIMCLGNHENRINSYTNDNAQMFGFLTTDCLKYKEAGWTVIPFLKPYQIERVKFQHYFTQGLKDMPISGINAPRTMTQMSGLSCIQGHTHELKIYREGRGEERWGLIAGCYFEHEEDYVSVDAQASWWRGVVMLHNVDNGKFNPTLHPLSELKQRYKHLVPKS